MKNPYVYELVEWDTGRVIVHGTRRYIADVLCIAPCSVDTIISHARKGSGATRVALCDPAIHYRAIHGDLITASCNLASALGFDDLRPAMEECRRRNEERGRF